MKRFDPESEKEKISTQKRKSYAPINTVDDSNKDQIMLKEMKNKLNLSSGDENGDTSMPSERKPAPSRLLAYVKDVNMNNDGRSRSQNKSHSSLENDVLKKSIDVNKVLAPCKEPSKVFPSESPTPLTIEQMLAPDIFVRSPTPKNGLKPKYDNPLMIAETPLLKSTQINLPASDTKPCVVHNHGLDSTFSEQPQEGDILLYPRAYYAPENFPDELSDFTVFRRQREERLTHANPRGLENFQKLNNIEQGDDDEYN